MRKFFNFLSVYTVILQLHISTTLLSERRVSNPQPPAWKAGALPIELLSLILASMRQPLLSLWGQEDSNLRSSRNRFTVCPIWPLWYIPIKKSRRRDSNPRPTDYKSVALPAELLRLNL